MLIHSIVPYEQIFETAPQQDTRLRPINGGLAEVCGSGNEERISRIISTNPAAFLNPDYQPGCLYPNIPLKSWPKSDRNL